MRLVIISEAFPLLEDDNAHHNADFVVANALKDAGHQVLIASFDYDNAQSSLHHYRQNGLDIIRVGANAHRQVLFQELARSVAVGSHLTNALHLYLSCREYIKEFEPDVIECQGVGALSYFWALEGVYPLIVRCNGPLSDGGFARLDGIEIHAASAMEYASLAMADHVIAASSDLAEELYEHTLLPLEKLSIIELPQDLISTAFLNKCEPNLDDFPRILLWAENSSRDELIWFLNSLPLISRECPNFSLVIAGIDAKSENMVFVERRLLELELFDRVTFVRFKDRRSNVEFCIKADICVFSDARKTDILKADEAAASGACVVLISPRKASGFLVSEQTCLIANPANVQSLKTAVVRVAQSTSLREQLRLNAWNKGASSAEVFEKLTSDAYKMCISKRLSRTLDYDCSSTSMHSLKCLAALLNGPSLENAYKESTVKQFAFGSVSTLEEAYALGLQKGKGEPVSPNSVVRMLRKGLIHKIKRK